MESVEEEDKARKKITQLLLNTPGACFLCLQDYSTGEDLNGGGGIIDLTTICRYLNINQSSLLSTSLKNDGDVDVEELEQDSCTFSVKLCPKCVELTEKLNDMIIQLEKAKLMVNFHLHSFHKILEGDEEWEESLEWINLLGRMHANLMEAKLVQRLRREAREKSFKILKKAEAAKPQVILPRLQAPPQPSYHPPPSPPSTFSTSGGTSIKTLLSQLTTANSTSSIKSRKSKHRPCPYCPKSLSISKFAVHLSCLHSDKLLSSHFPPSLPPSEPVCRQVLYSQVIAKATKIPSFSTAIAPRLGCHVCGITYSDGTLLKQHFLTTHTDKLVEEIKNFKENPKTKGKKLTKKTAPKIPLPPPIVNSVEHLIKNLQETSLINPPKNDKTTTVKAIKKSQCPFCQSSMISSQFVRHLANLHSDKLLAPFTTTASLDKLKNDNPNHFSQLCRKVLATQLTKAAKVPGTVTTPGGGGGTPTSSKLRCHLCARNYSDRRNLKYHFLVDHTNSLCEELIKMQNVNAHGVQNKLKKKMVIIKKVEPLEDESVDIKPFKKILRRSAEEKTCTICRQTFFQFGKLRRHQVNLHPDQLFLKCKPGWMGGAQFLGNCKEIFRREVGKATYGKPGDKIYRCGYCQGGKTSYKGHVDLIVHLVFNHREEMEGKLKEGMGEENGSAFQLEGGEEGGDEMIVEEEDEGDFDVKPDIGELDEMISQGTFLNGVGGNEEDGHFDYLEQQSRYFGDDGGDRELVVGEVIENVTEQQSELLPAVKMEV